MVVRIKDTLSRAFPPQSKRAVIADAFKTTTKVVVQRMASLQNSSDLTNFLLLAGRCVGLGTILPLTQKHVLIIRKKKRPGLSLTHSKRQYIFVKGIKIA